jgi:hypothetical protein
MDNSNDNMADQTISRHLVSRAIRYLNCAIDNLHAFKRMTEVDLDNGNEINTIILSLEERQDALIVRMSSRNGVV